MKHTDICELRCRFFVAMTWVIGISFALHAVTILFSGCILTALFFRMNISRRYILRNLLIVLPFLTISFVTLLLSDGFPVTKEAAGFACLIATRMSVCLLAVNLVAGNNIHDYIAAFQSMRFPNSLTSTLFLTQRYIHVVGRQFSASRKALVSRLFSPRLRLKTLKIHAQIIGGMTLHAIDRSEHVRKAMESRGFQGRIRIGQAMPVRLRDVLESTLAVLPLLVILLVERWYFP
jgi:cobalt/nickel transport system permease protein